MKPFKFSCFYLKDHAGRFIREGRVAHRPLEVHAEKEPGMGHQRTPEEWYFFEAGKNNYFIVSAYDGKVVDLGRWVGHRTIQTTDFTGEPTQTFGIVGRQDERVDLECLGDTGRPREVWTPQGFMHGVHIVKWKSGPPVKPNQPQGVRRVECAGSTKDMATSTVQPFQIGTPPKLTSHEVPPQRTAPVLIGVCPMPFFYVKDPDPRFATHKQQVRSKYPSPFYFLARHNFWERTEFFHQERGGARSRTVTYKVGVKQTTARSFQSTTSLGFDASLKTVVKAVTKALSAKLSQEIKVTVSETREEVEEKTTQEKVEWPLLGDGETRRTHAYWVMVDRYSLHRGPRLAEDPIDTWEARPEGILAHTSFTS